MNNIVVDLETAGTKSTSLILSIGAYCLEAEKSFYLTVKSNLYNFTVDQSTLDWWNQQDVGVKTEAFSGTVYIVDALNQFSAYCKSLGEFFIWGNSVSFDLGILANAYSVYGMPVPWSYRQEMCYRTIKNLFPEIETIKPDTPHHALDDAVAETRTLKLYLEKIKLCL